MVDDRYMARVFLVQARATQSASWRATLLGWARRRRVAAHRGQRSLF